MVDKESGNYSEFAEKEGWVQAAGGILPNAHFLRIWCPITQDMFLWDLIHFEEADSPTIAKGFATSLSDAIDAANLFAAQWTASGHSVEEERNFRVSYRQLLQSKPDTEIGLLRKRRD